MFNIKLSDNTTYSEVGQINPLRWKTLYKQDDGTFTDQSGWVKCKDFYNDTVAFFKENSIFSIYGYKNQIKKNDEGVYFLLKFIKDKASFFKNMDVVNERLEKDLGCRVNVLDHDEPGTANDQVVICIPLELWESTYRISMITFVIRLCNYGQEYKCWEDLWDTHAPSYKIESAFTQDAKNNALQLGFLVPEKFKEYWFYCGAAYNSKVTPKQTGSTIHNNGVSNWSMFMKQAGV